MPDRPPLAETPEFSQQPDIFSEFLEKARLKPVQAIVILGGGVKKITSGEKNQVITGEDFTDEEGPEDASTLLHGQAHERQTFVRFSSTSYTDPKSGAGKAKDIAALEIAKELAPAKDQGPVVIVANSKAPYNRSSISDAEVSEAALRKYHINNEIILQKHSIDTFTELLETLRLAVEKKWTHIAIVSTETQRRRAKAMANTIVRLNEPAEFRKIELALAEDAYRFSAAKIPERTSDHAHYKETLEFLKKHNPKVEISIIAAEDVLPHRDPERYGKLIQQLKADPAYRKKIQQDENDYERWLSGEYTKRGEPFIEQWKNGELP